MTKYLNSPKVDTPIGQLSGQTIITHIEIRQYWNWRRNADYIIYSLHYSAVIFEISEITI